MTQSLSQQRRIDFLRHIVNRVLASSKVSQQIIDDIKKAVGRAEDRFKFDAFSGDIRRLADYIRSRDFNDLVNILKSTPEGLDVLRRILEEAKKAYSDIPEVVEAIEQRLKELGEPVKGEIRREQPIRRLAEKLQEKGFRVIRVDEKEALIELSKDTMRIRILGIRVKDSKIIADIEVHELSAANEDEFVGKLLNLVS